MKDTTNILKFQLQKKKKLNQKVKKFLTFLNCIGKPKVKEKRKKD